MRPAGATKRMTGAGHGAALRTAVALCVLALVVLGVLAGERHLARGGSGALDRLADGAPPAGRPAEAGGVAVPCGACEARHRHITRQREATP
jgi:hypothetical protein